jgi:hypothetical protein
MSFGFVLPALTIGLGAIRIKPQRGFTPTGGQLPPLVAHATIEELHRDDLEITEHPVELGAPVADHAFKRPAEVVIHCAWSNSPPGSVAGQLISAAIADAPQFGKIVAGVRTLAAAGSLLSGNSPSQVKAIYAQLIALQGARVPFDVYTGKRAYKNMLFKSLSVTTDAEHENSLLVTAVCRQVIIATTRTVQIGGVSDTGQKSLVETFSVPAPAVVTRSLP